MPVYDESNLEKIFDDHKFFDPECFDRRVREVNMRTKRCLGCPGLSSCRKYPEFWLHGGEKLEEAPTH